MVRPSQATDQVRICVRSPAYSPHPLNPLQLLSRPKLRLCWSFTTSLGNLKIDAGRVLLQCKTCVGPCSSIWIFSQWLTLCYAAARQCATCTSSKTAVVVRWLRVASGQYDTSAPTCRPTSAARLGNLCAFTTLSRPCGLLLLVVYRQRNTLKNYVNNVQSNTAITSSRGLNVLCRYKRQLL